MRTTWIALIAVLLVAALSACAVADGPAKKLGRGAANIVTSPLEILKSVQDTSKESGYIAGFTWGPVKGIFKTITRATVGVYEIVTFPIPMPRDYKPILKEPEFFLMEDAE